MSGDNPIKSSVNPISLPFDEAIDFFRQKVNLPTERWADLWKGMHARGFMVAGAMKSELLSDFHEAVDKAISEGTTIETFRKDFDKIVSRHGWSYNGGRGWRTRVILETNVRTAYSAGRHKQMTEPEMLKMRPYWEYRHSDSKNPRIKHLSWDGLVLRADDPWWITHNPPNGWGCDCKKFALSQRDLGRMGKKGPDTAPDDGTYEWEDKKTGKVHTIPNGIDPGWDYSVGEAAWGRTQANRLMDDKGPWVDLDPWGPEKYGRPQNVDIDAPVAAIGKPVEKGNVPALRASLKKALGADEVLLADPLGEHTLVTQAVVDHILEDQTRWDGRDAFFPLIPELIQDPFELWISFAKSQVSGRVGIRRKYVKAVRVDKDRSLGLWAETMNGHWVAGDFFSGKSTEMKRLRQGRLVFGRK